MYEWIVSKKKLMYTAATYIIAVISLALLSSIFSNDGVDTDFHRSILSTVLTIGAAIVGVRAYGHLNESTKVLHYMTIPSSLEEKFFVHWFKSLIGFIVFVITLHFVVSLLGQGIWAVFNLGAFSLLSLGGWTSELLLTTVFIHGFFFFGGAIFQKNPLIKSLLFLFVLGLVSIITMFTLDAMDIVTGLIQSESSVTVMQNGEMITRTNTQLPGGVLNLQNEVDKAAFENILTALMYIATVFFWAMGYRRFKTIEA
ncbi:hypothetical protein [Sediminitomix flava]|uniref:ABC-2 family transporter n=1 Tax=Sediminitomix flava TaxID=379075 RepID=A0A315ZVY5_SEDFL|nr:hypothetical protein [Sediminitomix flava]PWJ40833.1 hypothetical protein BC781_10492 [Sediminitomix flava]